MQKVCFNEKSVTPSCSFDDVWKRCSLSQRVVLVSLLVGYNSAFGKTNGVLVSRSKESGFNTSEAMGRVSSIESRAASS